jgi:hypothetical protein
VFLAQERQMVCRVSESGEWRVHHRHLFGPDNKTEPSAELIDAWHLVAKKTALPKRVRRGVYGQEDFSSIALGYTHF